MRRCLSNWILVLGFCAASGMGSPARSDTAVPNSASEVHPLLIGAQVPEVTLRDANGDAIELADVLSDKPTILFFYRGGW